MKASDESLRSAGPERKVESAVVGADTRTEGAPESKPDSET